MSTVVWHGIGPGHGTGYGQATKLFTSLIRDLGHHVVIAVMGERGKRNPLNHPAHAVIRQTGMWDGMPVIGPGLTEFGMPPQSIVREACGGRDPDLVLVLKDAWVLTPADYQPYNTAVWLASDTEPLGKPDRGFFAAAPQVRPVCMSLRTRRHARDTGLNPLFVPCGIDTQFWTPGDGRDAARDFLGLPRNRFIVGICAANIGPRKGWGEQLAAFTAFRARHPGALLLIHAAKQHPEGIDLEELATALGIRDAVIFGEHTAMNDAQMVNWFRSLDVLLQGSYGEGFGLPVTQAHACGVPVIGTDCSAITEKIIPGTGWLIPGQRWWNPHHRAWWTIPDIRAMTAALERAAKGKHWPAARIRDHALQWDAAAITKQHWAPVIEQLITEGSHGSPD